MQEVKISLQIGEITHEIGEKNNTDQLIADFAGHGLSKDRYYIVICSIN